MKPHYTFRIPGQSKPTLPMSEGDTVSIEVDGLLYQGVVGKGGSVTLRPVGSRKRK